MVTLYDFELSADCYAVRLMMNILGVGYETVSVDIYPGADNRADWFLKLNPEGTLPMLVDDGFVVRDASPCLIHLAGRYDETDRWSPIQDALRYPQMLRWFDYARRLTASTGVARTGVAFGWDADLPALQGEAHRLLRQLDEHLWFGEKQGRDWLIVGDHPTIADIAVFPDVVLSEEGGVSRQDYPAIRRWLDRVRRIPGFVVMSGVFPASPAFTPE
jgi:glutathione S-transferase